MPLVEVHVEDTWCHIEGQVIREHCDEPVRGVDVCWHLELGQVLVQIRQVHLCEHLELETKDSESALGQKVEHIPEIMLVQNRD